MTAFMGCGEPTLPSFFSSVESEIGRAISVVVEVDYPDVYGDIELHVDGHGIYFVGDQRADCGNPTFTSSVGKWKFGALSEKLFYWADELDVGSGADCVFLRLAAKDLSTRVWGLAMDYPESCYPFDVKLESGPFPRTNVGGLSTGGFDVEAVRHPSFEEELARLMEAARAGTVVLWGGGIAGGTSRTLASPGGIGCQPLQGGLIPSHFTWGWSVHHVQ
jgi:hypothetical protein